MSKTHDGFATNDVRPNAPWVGAQCDAFTGTLMQCQKKTDC